MGMRGSFREAVPGLAVYEPGRSGFTQSQRKAVAENHHLGACLRKLHLSEHPKSASGTLNARTGCLWDVQGREVLDR